MRNDGGEGIPFRSQPRIVAGVTRSIRAASANVRSSTSVLPRIFGSLKSGSLVLGYCVGQSRFVTHILEIFRRRT
jgi:hypothetical protein